jgi:ribonucleoside-triphosphate reductase
MDQCIQLFKTKRNWMENIIENNRMPFATQRPKDPVTGEKGCVAVDIDALVCTIGVIGINEMVQYHTGSQLHESKDAFKFAIRVMTEMEMYAHELSQKHGLEIALARTPAETTGQRFSVSDMLHDEYRDCVLEVVKGDKEAALANLRKTTDLPVYYTNGTHVPPGANVSLIDRINLEHVFFPIVDGGNICHIWMGEGSPDAKGLKEFAMNIAKNTQIGYFAFTKDMTVCLNDFHMMSGLKCTCENCGSTNVEQMSRVTGYVQAVGGWNNGKRQELADRMRYGSSDMI